MTHCVSATNKRTKITSSASFAEKCIDLINSMRHRYLLLHYSIQRVHDHEATCKMRRKLNHCSLWWVFVRVYLLVYLRRILWNNNNNNLNDLNDNNNTCRRQRRPSLVDVNATIFHICLMPVKRKINLHNLWLCERVCLWSVECKRLFLFFTFVGPIASRFWCTHSSH